MRIKEFLIHQYGPLSDTGLIRLHPFNLFWGENEDGKTLTLEALIRLLMGRNRKTFPGIDRVAEKPDGYLLLETDEGKEQRLPDAGQLTDHLEITVEECRNLFIIRNSDLSIARESEFFDTVSNRLTGLRTNQIKRLKGKLRDLGQFTGGMDTLNTKDNRYLKKRLRDAKELVDEIREFVDQAPENGYDVLEEKLVRLQRQLRENEDGASALDLARLREKYESGRSHLDSLLTVLQKIEPLRKISDEEFSRWQKNDALIEEKETERKTISEQLRVQRNELIDEKETLAESGNLFQISLKRKEEVDDSLKPLLKQYGTFKENQAKVYAGKKFFQVIFVIACFMTLIAVGGIFQNPQSLPILTLAILSGTVALVMAVLFFLRFIRPRGERRQLEEQIVHQAGQFGIPGEEIDEIQEQIQRFEENLKRHQQKIAKTEGRIAYLEESCRSLEEERLVDIQNRLKEARAAIQRTQTERDIELLEIYQDKLEERQRYEMQIKESVSVLKNQFGASGDSLGKYIDAWKAAVAELEEYKAAATDVKFDEKSLEQKRSDFKKDQESLEQLQRQMRDLREQLTDFERLTFEATLPEDDLLPCRTLNDLQYLIRQLESFIADTDSRQHTVRSAIQIFDDIENDERQKVSGLFGEDSTISHFYNEITEGLYPGVYYDSANGGVRVQRRDGKLLQPEWLSSGAYDQLYFSIRLALGEKLLHNERGFFILDDPFLKSDTERLKRQLEVLLEISRRGWQIIYFSAKDEVKNALAPHIDNDQVALLPVPGVDFKIER